MKSSSSSKVGELLNLQPAEREVRPVSHDWKCETGNEETHDDLKQSINNNKQGKQLKTT